MKIIQINPYKKEIKLAELSSLDDDNYIEKVKKDAIQIEKDLKIVAYPMLEKGNKYFYYVKENKEDKGKIYTFNGIGIVFGNISVKVIEEIKEKIVW